VTGDTQRLEVVEVVHAAQRAVRSQSRLAMVDLEPVRRLPGTPRPHRVFVRSLAREPDSRRALRRDVTAPAAAVFVAPLGGAPRLRPPVVVPKCVAAAVAAPGAAAGRQFLTAPGAATRPRPRERTDRQERGALRCAYRNAGSRSASNCGERLPARKSGSTAIENCIPVQNRPNSPKRDDASSKRIS
jgi:hypothetical protein